MNKDIDMQKKSRGESDKTIVVIGGGIGGLYSAWKLLEKGFNVTILEKQNHLGGLSASITYNEYKMDVGPHFITTPKNMELTNEIEELMKDEIISIPDIHKWYRVFFNNSVQEGYPLLYDLIFKHGFKSFLHSLFSFSISKIKYSCTKNNFKSAKEYIICNYGRYLYDSWFKPYLDFNYGENDLPTTIVQGRFPELKLRDIIRKVKKRKKKGEIEKKTSKVNYWYFKQGIGSFSNMLTKKIESLGGKIILSADIKNIEHEKKPKNISIIQDGKESILNADMILYTTHPAVTKIWFKDHVKFENVKKKSSNAILIFLFVDHPKIVNWWLMTNYDSGFSFFRITQQNYLSNFVSPPKKSLLCVEINTKEKEYLWNLEETELIKIIKEELKKMQIFDIKKIESYKIFKFKDLYQDFISTDNSNSEKISKVISSLENEFMIGVEIDPGTLVTKRIEDSANPEKENISLGGIYLTLEQSKQIVENIIIQNKKF